MKSTGKFFAIGDTRIKKWFAIFPVVVEDFYKRKRETRWLEFVMVEQELRERQEDFFHSNRYWKNIKFVEAE